MIKCKVTRMLQVLKCLVFLRGGTGLTQVRGLRAGQCCVKLGASHRRRGVHLALVQGGGCGARLFFEIPSPHWVILKYDFQFGHTELRPSLCAFGLQVGSGKGRRAEGVRLGMPPACPTGRETPRFFNTEPSCDYCEIPS